VVLPRRFRVQGFAARAAEASSLTFHGSNASRSAPGHRAYKLRSGSTSEYGRCVKPLRGARAGGGADGVQDDHLGHFPVDRADHRGAGNRSGLDPDDVYDRVGAPGLHHQTGYLTRKPSSTSNTSCRQLERQPARQPEAVRPQRRDSNSRPAPPSSESSPDSRRRARSHEWFPGSC